MVCVSRFTARTIDRCYRVDRTRVRVVHNGEVEHVWMLADTVSSVMQAAGVVSVEAAAACFFDGAMSATRTLKPIMSEK